MRASPIIGRVGGGDDFVPDTVDWPNSEVTHQDSTWVAYTPARRITGISGAITLRAYTSPAYSLASPLFKAWAADTEFGTYTQVGSMTPDGGFIEFSVAPNKWVKFSLEGSTSKGIKSDSLSCTVYNWLEGTSLVDTFILSLTVDSQDMYGYDVTPNYMEWSSSLTGTTSCFHEVIQQFTGVEKACPLYIGFTGGWHSQIQHTAYILTSSSYGGPYNVVSGPHTFTAGLSPYANLPAMPNGTYVKITVSSVNLGSAGATYISQIYQAWVMDYNGNNCGGISISSTLTK